MNVLCYGNNKPTCNVETHAFREKVVHLACVNGRKNNEANGPITLDEIYVQYTLKCSENGSVVVRNFYGTYNVIQCNKIK